MPAKSREQKVRAQERRLRQLGVTMPDASQPAPAGEQEIPVPHHHHTQTYSLPKSLDGTQQASSGLSRTTYLTDAAYVRKDIIRIIFLTFGVIAIEFILYWLLEIQKIRF